MKHLNKTYDGPLEITEDATLGGMVNGDVIVMGGANLTVTGMITGNLILKSGATANGLGMGTVSGSIVKEGGSAIGFGLPGSM